MAVNPSSFTKQPYEELGISLDFSKRLEDTTTITSHTATITNSSGTDVSETMKAGSSVSGQTVRVGVKGGTTGSSYKITIKIVTDMAMPDGNYEKFEGDIVMRVVEE